MSVILLCTSISNFYNEYISKYINKFIMMIWMNIYHEDNVNI